MAVEGAPSLARRLGLFDAVMIVMGGIVGAGIFRNPQTVAAEVPSSGWIHAAWAAGGLLALCGAFIYAELGARRPHVGGQYAYLREAFHPMVAFLYGWVLLLVIQSGGMAAVAVAFAQYFKELTGATAADKLVAAGALAVLMLINCFGVRAGGSTQSLFMSLKIMAIAALVLCGFLLVKAAAPPVNSPTPPAVTCGDFGAAMIQVVFAYGGWQTATFVAGEMRDPKRDLPLGLLLGVAGVIALYLTVNWVCLRALGPAGLAATKQPATEVVRAAVGERGVPWMALAICVSTLGFLAQGMLTAPRVYYAMARDGLFFSQVSWLHPRSRAPVVAITLQAVLAALIVQSGTYDQIINYVVSVDFIFYALAGVSLFLLRRRDKEAPSFAVPLHPLTTIVFVLGCLAIVFSSFRYYPTQSFIGLGILLAGVPAYLFWRRS